MPKKRLITIAILPCCHVNETILAIAYILFEGHENKDVNSKKRTKGKLLPFFPNDVRKIYNVTYWLKINVKNKC